MTTYRAVFCDVDCGHDHRSWETAKRCGARTIANAKAALAGTGPTFAHPATPELCANYTPDGCVRVYIDGMRRGG